MAEIKYGIDRESLYQLFLQGPTYDGDVISKSARDDLVDRGYAARYEGYNFITREGVIAAIAMKMDRDKQTRQRQDRAKRIAYDRVEEAIKQNVPYKEKVESIVSLMVERYSKAGT